MKVLHIEQTPPMGNKESAHMCLVAHPMRNLAWISLPSGLYEEKVRKLQLHPVELY